MTSRIPTVVLALLLAGCASPAAPSATQPPPSPAASATTLTPTATPTPSSTPTPRTTGLKVGQTAELPSVLVTVAKKKTVKMPGLGNYRLFLVKSCVKADAEAQLLGNVDWNASGPGGENYNPSFVVAPEFEPSYPDQRKVLPGKCIKGWVAFDAKHKMVELVFDGRGTVEDDPATWQIG